MVVFCASAAVSSAEVLMADGFQTGTGGYSAGNARDQHATAGTVGFSASSSWAGGTGIPRISANDGLALPETFPAEMLYGSGAYIVRNSGTATPARGLYRLADTAVIPESGTLYFRMLMRMDSGVNASLAEGRYAGGGLLTETFNGTSDTLNTLSARPDGLQFLFRKTADGTDLVLAAGGQDTVLVPAADLQIGVPYLCLAECAIGAGENGAEVLRASAVPVAEWAGLPSWSDPVSAELCGTDGTFIGIGFYSPYQIGNTSMIFDEAVLATALSDVVYAEGGVFLSYGSAEAVTAQEATVSLTVIPNGGTVASVTLSYREAGTEAWTEVPFAEIPEDLIFSYTFTGLEPAAGYEYFHTVVTDQGTAQTPVQSFETVGLASFGAVTVSQDETSGDLQFTCTLEDAGFGTPIVEALYGTDADALEVIETFPGAVSGQVLSVSVAAPATPGVSQFVQFRATTSVGDRVLTAVSELAQYDWTGSTVWSNASGDSHWSTAANWNPAMVPNSLLSAVINVAADVKAGAETLAAESLSVQAPAATVRFSFAPETQLTVGAFNFATESGANDVRMEILGGTFRITGSDASICRGTSRSKMVFRDSVTTMRNMTISGGTSNAWEILDGATVNVGNANIGGAGFCSVTVEKGGVWVNGSVTTYSQRNRIDVNGGTVTNSGVLVIGKNNGSGADTVRIRNGGVWMQGGTVSIAGRNQGHVLEVSDGGLFEGAAVKVGHSSDGWGAPTGRLVVSNGTFRVSSVSMPEDSRYGVGQTAFVYGDTPEAALFTVSGNLQLGCGSIMAGQNHQAQNAFTVAGGTLRVDGTIRLGLTHDANTNNTLRLTGRTADVSAAELTVSNGDRVVYVVPAGAGYESQPVLRIDGTAAFDAGSGIRVEVPDFAAGRFTLLSAGTIAGLDESMIEVTGSRAREYSVVLTEQTVTLHLNNNATLLLVH